MQMLTRVAENQPEDMRSMQEQGNWNKYLIPDRFDVHLCQFASDVAVHYVLLVTLALT